MNTFYDRGTHVQWKTLDGIIHTGVVQQIVTSRGHNVIEDGQIYAVFVPLGYCVKYHKKKVKK